MCPELEEIFEGRERDEETVGEAVEEEEDEVLVVVEGDAVVDPGAVVVHLADAPLAHGAVVRALRLDAAALRALEDHLLVGDS